MKAQDRKNVIKFYENQVYWLGMPKSDELTDDTLKDLRETLWFARWMLSQNYNECVDQVKKAINKIINKTLNK